MKAININKIVKRKCPRCRKLFIRNKTNKRICPNCDLRVWRHPQSKIKKSFTEKDREIKLLLRTFK